MLNKNKRLPEDLEELHSVKKTKGKRFLVTLFICILIAGGVFTLYFYLNNLTVKHDYEQQTVITQQYSPLHSMSDEDLGLDKALIN